MSVILTPQIKFARIFIAYSDFEVQWIKRKTSCRLCEATISHQACVAPNFDSYLHRMWQRKIMKTKHPPKHSIHIFQTQFCSWLPCGVAIHQSINMLCYVY